MFIVPVKKDKIKTTDKRELTVLSYTPYKAKPAVYVIDSEKEVSIVFLSEIEEIQNTKVELTKSGIFKTFGTVKRVFHLPQPDDIIRITDADHVVSSIELKDVDSGLTFKTESKDVFFINDITDVEYSNSSRFHQTKFLVYYKDYLPLKVIQKK